jgi:cobalt/nickel transport system permease protein
LHLEEFAVGKSIWHRMDPRVKILGLLFFAVITAVASDFRVMFIAAGAALFSLVTAGLDLRQVAIRLLAVNGFVLFLWFFLPFTTPGEVVARLGGMDIYREGVILGLSITLKANSIAAVTIVLLGTSSILNLVHALVHLKVPGKLVQLFFFSYRYVTVIHGEYSRLRASMKARCFKLRMDFFSLRCLATLVGMLFVRSSDRSERIYNAMVLRGFNGVFWTLDHFHMHRSDWIAAAAMASLLLVMTGLQIPWRSI